MNPGGREYFIASFDAWMLENNFCCMLAVVCLMQHGNGAVYGNVFWNHKRFRIKVVLGQFFELWDTHENGNVSDIRDDIQAVMRLCREELMMYRNNPDVIDIERLKFVLRKLMSFKIYNSLRYSLDFNLFLSSFLMMIPMMKKWKMLVLVMKKDLMEIEKQMMRQAPFFLRQALLMT